MKKGVPRNFAKLTGKYNLTCFQIREAALKDAEVSLSDEYRKKDYSNKEAVSVRVLLQQKEYFLQPFLENSVDSLSKDELNKEIISFQNFALDRFYHFADCKAKGDAY